MELTVNQKRQIVEKGFVHIPGVVPRIMVDAALKAINHSIGEGMDKADMRTIRSQSYAPELRNDPAIVGLLNATPAWSLAESAVGHGQLQPVRGGQIAVRFPVFQDPPAAPGPHLDGMHTPDNGVPFGKIMNFTLLAAVFLSDVLTPYSGNFTVWPGTHHTYERYFREHGPMALLNGMPDVPLPEPHQILARAGDIALCHYQIGHTACVNVSPHPRYAIFFRLSHVNHENIREEAMTDIWLEWEGIKSVMETA